MTVQEQPLPTQPLFVCLITGADLYANSLLPDAWPLTSKTHYSKTASYAIGRTPRYHSREVSRRHDRSSP